MREIPQLMTSRIIDISHRCRPHRHPPEKPALMRVLLVEDSRSLQASIAEGLRRSGYATDIVGDGRQGLRLAETGQYDVVILDIMLPSMDGLDVLRRLRDTGSTTAVLMLTARDTVPDRVQGLQLGADDYLVKPFAFDELLARVQAIARRAHGAAKSVIDVGPLRVDIIGRQAHVDGRSVSLTPREFGIVEYLAHHVGTPVSRAELESHLYDEYAKITSNAVDVAVCSLRAKLKAAGCPPLIHTRRGFGYVLNTKTRTE